jgi:protein HOOK3
VKSEALQAEHDRMLALQQRTNQKLRDLEIQNEESRSLLLRSLLEKDNLSLELLQIMREETLRQIREQIQGVIATPLKAQPKVLEVTSSDIAETVVKSHAALDKVKKVSNQQFHLDDGPSSAHKHCHANTRGSSTAESQLEVSGSAATLVSSPYKGKGKAKAHGKSEVSASTAGTRKTSWGSKLASLISPSKSLLLATDDGQPTLPLASLSCAWLLKSILIGTT